jgi:single-strand DNA-binding protein
MGNLGQDPELRYTQSQTAVVTMSVATTDVRMVDGNRQEQTEWHRVVVWGKQAENCAKYLKKGRTVFIEGKIQTRSWEDKNGGGKRYSTEVVAQSVRFVGGGQRGVDADQGSVSAGGFTGSSMDDSAGFGGGASAQFDAGFGGPSTPSAEDIPF